MNRYFSSFLFTCSIYLFFIACIFYFLPTKIYKLDTKKTVKAIMIKVAPKRIKKELKPEKTQKTKRVKKPKKVKKTKIVKKPKRVKNVKKPTKIKQVKKVKKDIVKTVVTKQPHTTKKLTTNEKSLPTKLQKQKKSLTTKRDLYFLKLRQKIQKHKIYPKIAVKRGMEGVCKVILHISPKGDLIDYKINGKKIFNRSIKKALKKTFPFPSQKNLFSENITLHVDLVYKLLRK